MQLNIVPIIALLLFIFLPYILGCLVMGSNPFKSDLESLFIDWVIGMAVLCILIFMYLTFNEMYLDILKM